MNPIFVDERNVTKALAMINIISVFVIFEYIPPKYIQNINSRTSKLRN